MSGGNAQASDQLSTRGNTQTAVGGIPPKAVRITKTDGTVLWSFEDGFACCDGSRVALESGQSIPFERISTIDFLAIDDENKANVRVILTDGRAIEGIEIQPSDASGKNDIGDVRIVAKQVKQIVFPR